MGSGKRAQLLGCLAPFTIHLLAGCEEPSVGSESVAPSSASTIPRLPPQRSCDEVTEADRDFFLALRSALARDDRRWVTAHMMFPTGAFIDNYPTAIAGLEQFLANYDTIVDEHVRRSIALWSPTDLLSICIGVRTLDSAVLFDRGATGVYQIQAFENLREPARSPDPADRPPATPWKSSVTKEDAVFYQQIRAAVVRNDRRWIADLMKYPLYVGSLDRRGRYRRIRISNADEYIRIFQHRFLDRDRIAHEGFGALWLEEDGVTVASTEVRFGKEAGRYVIYDFYVLSRLPVRERSKARG